MNKVMLLGRLTRDVEMRYSQSAEAVAVASFGVAVVRKYKRNNEPDVDFFNCTAFGKTAENISKYFKKGQRISVFGYLRNEEYTDKTGNKRQITKIMVDEFDFCESSLNSSVSNGSVSNGSVSNGSNNSRIGEQTLYQQEFYKVENVSDDDVPF